LHHRDAIADETHGSVTQIVTFPALFGDRVITEQRLGDIAVTRPLESPIQGAQRQEKAVSSGWRKRNHLEPWRTSCNSAPKSQRGGSAMLEQLIEGQDHSHGQDAYIL
jgi:hypothetical protein